MNFQESIEYLYGLGYELSVKKFGLENTYTLLEALENPNKNFLKVQVAGTNGKGSTCAFLESILTEAGIKVGLNTSPHLVSVTERIRVNNVEISEEKFAGYVAKLKKVSEKLVESKKLEGMPTFFEHITVIAQMYFAENGVDVAILETGLGGRFDATTATEAEVVAITPIDLDHTKTLGDTIAKISAEKAAIIRKDVEAVIAGQKPEALQVILDKCGETVVKPKFAEDVQIEIKNEKLKIKTQNEIYENVELGLKGKHQIENAVTAILLAETLQEKGFLIEKKQIAEGLRKAVHKGRLEFWADEFEKPILFDGAHNAAGAEALRAFLLDEIKEPITMIFGAMGDKQLDKISKILFPLADKIIFTTPENPRAMPAKNIAEFTPKNFDGKKVFVIEEIPQAFEKAKEIAGAGLILVTGSLYLIGELQGYLKNKKVQRRLKVK